MRPSRATAWAADLWTVVLVAILLSPLAARGYPLGRDMVFTPRQPLNLDSVGLGTASPRAVPLDALVALASQLAGGAITGRVVLAVPLLLAGLGARRLLRGHAATELLVAGLAVWNPFVIERLALGPWALLWAYGALPWLVMAATRLRVDPTPRHLAAATLWMAVAAITPSGALIAGAAFLALAVSRPLRRHLPTLAAVLIVQLPWLVPALLSPAGGASDPRAVAAFAARAERPGGVAASLLGLGGIWDSGSTPVSRGGPLGYLSAALVVVCLVVAAARGRISRRAGRGHADTTPPANPAHIGLDHEGWRRLAWLGAVGFVLAVLPAVPGGAALARGAVRAIPGAGILRDSQKWLLVFVLLAVLCVGVTVRSLQASLRRAILHRVALRPLVAAFVVAVAVLPLLLLPDALATVRPTLTPARYPDGWSEAAGIVNGSRASTGDVLVLPFDSYRHFDWVHAENVIDPAPRWLRPAAVVQDRLAVSGQLLTGEDPRAALLATVLAGPPSELAASLARAGIGWVWVEQGTRGQPVPALTGLRLLGSWPAVSLYRVPGPVALQRVGQARVAAVLGADALAAVTVLTCLAGMAVLRARRCYTRQ